MTDESIVMVLEVEGEVDGEFSDDIKAATQSDVRTVTKHGLAGDVSTWLLIGNFVVTSLAALAPIVTNFVKDRRVKSVKLGDLVIDNPTPDQVEKVLRALANQKHGST